jgi:putative addiction module component (TIGR02574 family)
MGLLTSDEIVRLSPPERLALIAQLWDSLDEGEVSLSSAQVAELDRRLDSFEQDLPETVTWAELKAELEQRCR